MLKTVETKYSGVLANNTLLGQTASQFNVIPLNDIAEIGGPTTQWLTRVGQEYILKGFMLNWNFGNFIATVGDPNEPLHVRMLVLEGRELVGATDPLSGTQMWKGVDDIKTSYLAISDSLQCMTYKIDPTYYRTIFDKKITLGLVGNGLDSKIISKWIPVNKTIKCKGAAEGFGQQNKRYFAVWYAWNPRRSGTASKYNYGYNFKTFFKDP